MTEQLGRFGHHPDPAIDFCVEADAIEGLAADVRARLAAHADLRRRVERVPDFIVGGDQHAIAAKNRLRQMFPGAFKNPPQWPSEKRTDE